MIAAVDGIVFALVAAGFALAIYLAIEGTWRRRR